MNFEQYSPDWEVLEDPFIETGAFPLASHIINDKLYVATANDHSFTAYKRQLKFFNTLNKNQSQLLQFTLYDLKTKTVTHAWVGDESIEPNGVCYDSKRDRIYVTTVGIDIDHPTQPGISTGKNSIHLFDTKLLSNPIH